MISRSRSLRIANKVIRFAGGLSVVRIRNPRQVGFLSIYRLANDFHPPMYCARFDHVLCCLAF